MIAHWDEAESDRAEAGHIAGEWTDLGVAAGTKTVGLSRIRVDPGKWSTLLHRQTAEEEIFVVLDGSGICLLRHSAFEVGPGDCMYSRVRGRWSSGLRRSGPGAASPTRRSRSARATSSLARPRAGSRTASGRARAA